MELVPVLCFTAVGLCVVGLVVCCLWPFTVQSEPAPELTPFDELTEDEKDELRRWLKHAPRTDR